MRYWPAGVALNRIVPCPVCAGSPSEKCVVKAWGNAGLLGVTGIGVWFRITSAECGMMSWFRKAIRTVQLTGTVIV